MNKRKDELKETKHFKKLATSNNFIKIPVDWAVRLELSPAELLIYATIAHATKYYEAHAYIGSVTSLCAMWNITPNTARKVLNHLHNKGMIIKEKMVINKKKVMAYKQLKVVQMEIELP